MPEVGGKKFAGEFGVMLEGLRQDIAATRSGLAGAITELRTELQSGKEIEKAIRSEAADVRKAFSEVLGNNPPVGETADPLKIVGGTG